MCGCKVQYIGMRVGGEWKWMVFNVWVYAQCTGIRGVT